MSELTDHMSQLAVSGAGNASSSALQSPEPPPMLELRGDERKVYDYICARLREAGIEHVTAGMPIAIIVRTYSDWLKACFLCETAGRTQQSKTGWHSPTPWAEDEKRLKMELGQWLPKACLTIPSLVRVRKDTGAATGQDDMFADLVQHATSAPRANSPSSPQPTSKSGT